MKLEKVFSMGNSLCRKVIRFFRDDARVPFEVPDSSAAKRCLFRRSQLLESGSRFERSGHAGTLAPRSADIVTGVRR